MDEIIDDLDIKCPKCGVTMNHHGIKLDGDYCAEIWCYDDEGGCGHKFKITPKSIEQWIYLDDFGYRTNKIV